MTVTRHVRRRRRGGRVGAAAAAVALAVAGTLGYLALPDGAPPAGPACTVHGQLPDPDCTPGAILPGVTEADVCTPGWAAGHRRVTAATRRDVLARYGGAPAGPYELDHLISLELGGTNDPANLWPQPGPVPNRKDRVENRLHQLVCAGSLDLAEAQRRIAEDWTSAAAAPF